MLGAESSRVLTLVFASRDHTENPGPYHRDKVRGRVGSSVSRREGSHGPIVKVQGDQGAALVENLPVNKPVIYRTVYDSVFRIIMNTSQFISEFRVHKLFVCHTYSHSMTDPSSHRTGVPSSQVITESHRA